MDYLFLDIGDILTIKDRTREGNDFDEYKIKLLEQIIKSTKFNIIWISSWIRNNENSVIENYLKERGFSLFDKVIGPITTDKKYYNYTKEEFDKIKIDLINEFINNNEVENYLIIDSDQIDTSKHCLAILDQNGINPLITIRIIKNYKNGIYLYNKIRKKNE